MAKRILTGFSTVGANKTKQRTFRGVELVKRDLTNHFYTRIGERTARPDWGCAIWDYVMEPMTPGLINQIKNECIRIARAERRCTLTSVNVVELPRGVRVELTLNFEPLLAVVDTLTLNFERRESTRWDGGY